MEWCIETTLMLVQRWRSSRAVSAPARDSNVTPTRVRSPYSARNWPVLLTLCDSRGEVLTTTDPREKPVFCRLLLAEVVCHRSDAQHRLAPVCRQPCHGRQTVVADRSQECIHLCTHTPTQINTHWSDGTPGHRPIPRVGDCLRHVTRRTITQSSFVVSIHLLIHLSNRPCHHPRSHHPPLLHSFTRLTRGSKPTFTTTPRTIGDRAFFDAAPCVWNTLPSSVTAPDTLGTFKRRLKTHFFATSFP